MFKKFISTALIIMLLFSCPSFNTLAASSNDSDIKSELTSTANYCLSLLKEKLNDSESTINYDDYSKYTSILEAGVSDESVTTTLLNYIKDNVDNDGKTEISNNGFDTYHNTYTYAILTLFLDELKEDSTNFNNINFVKLMEDSFSKDKIEDVSVYAFLPISKVISKHTDDLTNVSAIKDKLVEGAFLLYVSDESETGIDFFGVSVDNNSIVLSSLVNYYKDDKNIQTKVDNAISWTIEQMLSDGTFNYNLNSEYNAVNADSTGLGLKLLSIYEHTEKANLAYKGLLSFKSDTEKGAYTYNGEASDFASFDALYGLIEYYKLTDISDDILNNNSENDSDNNTDNSTNNSTILIVSISILAVVIILAIGIIIFKKKKK